MYKWIAAQSEFRLKVNCRKNLGWSANNCWPSQQNFILEFTFGLQLFTFSCNSLVLYMIRSYICLLLDSIVYGWMSSWSPPLFWRDIFYDNDACEKVPFCNMTPLTVPALFVDAPAAIYHFAEWCIKARKIIWRKNGTDSKFALCILSRVFFNYEG